MGWLGNSLPLDVAMTFWYHCLHTEDIGLPDCLGNGL